MHGHHIRSMDRQFINEEDKFLMDQAWSIYLSFIIYNLCAHNCS